jgi:hypothetical protein
MEYPDNRAIDEQEMAEFYKNKTGITLNTRNQTINQSNTR